MDGGRVDRLFDPDPPRIRGIIRLCVLERARSESVSDEPFAVT